MINQIWLHFQTSQDIAFNFYKNHIINNGPEPNLPGFLLTNEHMFWVAMQNKKCLKGKDFHAFSKIFSDTGFRETFGCSDDDKSIDNWLKC